MGKNCNCHKCQKKQEGHKRGYHDEKKGKKLITVSVGNGPNKKTDTTHGPFTINQGADIYFHSKTIKLGARPGSAQIGLEQPQQYVHEDTLKRPLMIVGKDFLAVDIVVFNADPSSFVNVLTLPESPDPNSPTYLTNFQSSTPGWLIKESGVYQINATVNLDSIGIGGSGPGATNKMFINLNGSTGSIKYNTSDTITKSTSLNIDPGDIVNFVYENVANKARTIIDSTFCIMRQ